MLYPISFRSLGLAAAIVAFSATGAAHAQDGNSTATQVVSTRGLDLSAEEGRALLRIRVEKAAHKVCAEVTSGIYEGDDFSDCVHDSFKTAWRQVQARIAVAQSQPMLASVATKVG